MKIIFIRHAESIKNIERRHGKAADGFGLTAKGIETSFTLGKRLLINDFNIDAVYTSNSQQVTETADIISNLLDINVIYLENFQSLDYEIVCGFTTEEYNVLLINKLSFHIEK